MQQYEIEKARHFIDGLDKIDRETGRSGQGGASTLIRTAMFAIKADEYADAYVYLEQAIKQLTPPA